MFLKKLNINLPYDPAILILGIYLREMKTYLHIKTYTYTQMFLAALFIIAKKKNQTKKLGENKCPSPGKWDIYVLVCLSHFPGDGPSQGTTFRKPSCPLQGELWVFLETAPPVASAHTALLSAFRVCQWLLSLSTGTFSCVLPHVVLQTCWWGARHPNQRDLGLNPSLAIYTNRLTLDSSFTFLTFSFLI